MLKLHAIPESSRRVAPSEQANRYPLVQPAHILRRFGDLTQEQRLQKLKNERVLRAATPVALVHWHFGALTPQQQRERGVLEADMRDDAMRGLPTCFGELA